MSDIALRGSCSRPLNAPAAFIHPCRPTVAAQPPSGPGCAHELKHDGYRLQIHIRDGRVRLYTSNGNNWTDRYPRIVEQAIRINGSAVQSSREGHHCHRLVEFELPLMTFDLSRLSCCCGCLSVQRNSVPSTQMRCISASARGAWSSLP
jgi:hypothetical protein